MACTTILVGKKASNDGSTMIARNDDGFFDVKKLVIVNPKDQPKKYKSVISHVEIELPDNPLRYSATPSVDLKHGIWAANGINECNVAMTATETITSNSRVLGADPLVRYQKATKKGEKDKIGGIGEEDIVVLVLQYIKSAREGVLRLGMLLEKYGTYEQNGIAFSDKDEIWWLETIGGHHFIARKVKDDEVVIMPNQFGLDRFDFDDAYGKQEENICSKDLKEFVLNNHLSLTDGNFNPRLAFGSHSDADHVYNTPRAWYMGRYLNNKDYTWEGNNPTFTPESDDIPWQIKPTRLITIEDVKYILSSYYQGTPYNPYAKENNPKKGIYRPIGISRTDVMAILQIRNNVPKEISAIEWICFGSNAFNAIMPVYTNVMKFPKYLSDVTLDASCDNLYWQSRLIGALADAHYGDCIMDIERYQNGVFNIGQKYIDEFDKKYIEDKNLSLLSNANELICDEVNKLSKTTLNKVLLTSSMHMKNGYSRSDN